MPAMAVVARLATLVDVADDGSGALRVSVSARHEALLEDGRRVLLAARGWSSSLHGPAPDGTEIWTSMPVEEIEDTARVVVGPDEPVDGHSQEDAENDHWAWLVEVLHGQGVDADASALRHLPHEVVLSERLLDRLGRGPGGTAS
jgi:hypothetical protein